MFFALLLPKFDLLNIMECSMDKLFDLMVMGAKYCLMCSAKLEDMVEVRIAGHLDLLNSCEATFCRVKFGI
jgi:hypothetical protein